MKKRHLVIIAVCCVVATGAVYAASVTTAQSDSVNSVQSTGQSKNSGGSDVGDNTGGASSSIIKLEDIDSTLSDVPEVQSEVPSSGASRAVNNSVQNGKLIPFSDEVYDSVLVRDEANYEESENAAVYDEGKYNNQNIAEEADNVIEFVTYMDQELTDVYSSFIVTNLSNNCYNMNFYIYNGDKLLCSVAGVAPGDAKSFELPDLLGDGDYTLTVVSEAVSSSGTVLDSLEQDVKVSITPSKVSASDGESKEAKSGDTYETSIVYDAETMQCSVILPAILSIVAGESGTDFDVSYRVVGLQQGTRFTLTAENGLDADNNVKLVTNSGTNGEISSVNAGLTFDESLDFVIGASESSLHTVGPVHCYVADGKIAKNNYYGTTRFSLKIEEG